MSENAFGKIWRSKVIELIILLWIIAFSGVGYCFWMHYWELRSKLNWEKIRSENILRKLENLEMLIVNLIPKEIILESEKWDPIDAINWIKNNMEVKTK